MKHFKWISIHLLYIILYFQQIGEFEKKTQQKIRFFIIPTHTSLTMLKLQPPCRWSIRAAGVCRVDT